jgi:hypothetical protein
VFTFFLDYAQTLLEYLDAKLLGGKILAPGGRSMFIGKQVVTCCAAVVLLWAVALVVFSPAPAQSKVWSIWVGSVTHATHPDDRIESTLYLTKPDPNTGAVEAKKDELDCAGARNGNELSLDCGSLTFNGHIEFNEHTEKGIYTGNWSNQYSEDKGTFYYTYSKESPSSVRDPARAG